MQGHQNELYHMKSPYITLCFLVSLLLNKQPCHLSLLYQNMYNAPGLLLIDALAEMSLNTHYDQLIEFKGEFGS